MTLVAEAPERVVTCMCVASTVCADPFFTFFHAMLGASDAVFASFCENASFVAQGCHPHYLYTKVP